MDEADSPGRVAGSSDDSAESTVSVEAVTRDVSTPLLEKTVGFAVVALVESEGTLASSSPLRHCSTVVYTRQSLIMWERK